MARGSAGGWSGGGNWQNNLRPNSLRRSTDGWDDDELGSVYNHRVVMRLYKFVAPYRGRLLLALIGTLGYAAMTRTMPLAVRGLIDGALHKDIGALNQWGWVYIVLAALSAGFYYVQLTSTGWIGHRLLLGLRRDMFAHLQKLSLRFYDNNEVGRVMSRVTSDVTSLQDLMTSGFLTIIGDIAGIGLSVAFLMYFDVRLALVTFTVVPVLVITMAVWQNYSRMAFIRVRQAIAVVNANLQENVSGVRVIQSLSREDENAKRFDNINQQNLRANVDAGRLTAAVTPAVEVIVAVGVSLVVVATAGTACCTARWKSRRSSRSRCNSSSSSTRCATSCSSTRSSSARWPAASACWKCSIRSRTSRTRRMPSTSMTSPGASTSTT